VGWVGGGIGEVHIGFCWGKHEGRHHLEKDIDLRIILKWILSGMGGHELCIRLTFDKNKRALAYTAMNLRFLQTAGKLLSR